MYFLFLSTRSFWFFKNPLLDKKSEIFNEWLSTYQRSYSSNSEYQLRLRVFWENYVLVTEHNQSNSSFKMKLNDFADLTEQEFENRFMGNPIDIKNLEKETMKTVKKTKTNTINKINDGNEFTDDKEMRGKKHQTFDGYNPNIPRKVDWVEKGAVTPIKDQSMCAACYAFATISIVESAYFIKYGKLETFSEQAIIDCGHHFSPNLKGCVNSHFKPALEFSIKVGVWKESDYPYEGETGECINEEKVFTKAASYEAVSENENSLIESVALAPTSCAFQLIPSVRFYHDGVLEVTGPCSFVPSHMVTIVGYDLDADIPFVLIKNSWGSRWGQKGFGKLKLIGPETTGTCAWMRAFGFRVKFD